MVMPPQFIIIGMPLPIMVIMVWQHCMNMSFIAGSIGAISQVIMPFGAMLQVILHNIIGIAIPGMAMPGIIIGFMPPIIGIMGIICIAVFMALSIIGDELFFVGVD